jgi:DNA-binding IclR family transcriptional regulator
LEFRIVQQMVLPERSANIQSVQRAVALLRALGDGAPELGVAELSRRVHLHKSTVSRLLATLLSAGLVERAAGSEKYHLGYELVRLANHAPQPNDVRVVSRPFLEELAQRSHETVHLAVLDDVQVINIEQIAGAHLIGDTNWVGRRTPLHCVANGKALVAFRSTRESKRFLSGKLARFTGRTITSKTALRAELARVRRLGYATARGEIEVGLNAVAAPVRDSAGRVVAAVSVSAPAYRMTRMRMAELGAMTVAIANKISLRLGYED